MKELYTELTQSTLSIDLRSDCQSLIDNTRSMSISVTEKRLTSDMWALREAKQCGEIRSLEHVPTNLMFADGLTKPRQDLREMLKMLMNGKVIDQTKQ